ncbi:MAG: hypothetical protein AB7K24_06455 [Gemmataceae bacterium]
MQLEFAKPTRIHLKSHSDFTEQWIQERIIHDPTILGVGDVEVVTAEKLQPKAGRLDLLLHDDQLNRRYEVELMLGATDPSHIIRCIEYWDIERRRYPSYDHVAVLVAEDITSRFLNVISLFAGSIPLIAVQMVALQIGNNIVLHFVRVLDQTALRTDDEYESGAGNAGPTLTDRIYWEGRVAPKVLAVCDNVLRIVEEQTEKKFTLVYRKRIIEIAPVQGGESPLWMIPRKTLVRIGGYVQNPEKWVKRFDGIGQLASLRRGNKAVLVSYKPEEIESQGELLQVFLRQALDLEASIEEED